MDPLAHLIDERSLAFLLFRRLRMWPAHRFLVRTPWGWCVQWVYFLRGSGVVLWVTGDIVAVAGGGFYLLLREPWCVFRRFG